jgi:cellobiose phosphorylase
MRAIARNNLWLPLATCRYVRTTGDTGVLDVPVPFIEGRAPEAGEESCYDLPAQSAEVAGLYGHCVRAIERSLRFGVHGLPLMGSCDWNDGMNIVGAGGKGESVWLGFLQCAVLTQFSELAARRSDRRFARCLSRRPGCMTQSSNASGAWYRRAFRHLTGSPLALPELRMPHRFDRTELVGLCGAGARRAGRGGPAPRSPDAALIQLLIR